MKKFNIKLTILGAIILILLGTTLFAREITTYQVNGQPVEAVKGELLVKFKTDVSLEAKTQNITAHGAKKIGQLRNIGVTKLSVPDHSLEKVLEDLEIDPDVEFAEPNYIYTTQQKFPEIYNDAHELEDNQWGLHKIDAHFGWDIETGNGEVVVAVIDSGVDLDHRDLQENIWHNPDEEETGTDTAGNGYVDDLWGWNFVDNDNDPNPDSAHIADGEGHGTHVAGIAGATGENEVVGVSWTNKIMALRALAYDSVNISGNTADIAEAINYAADNGAHIINLSLGGDEHASSLELAVDFAYDAGCVLVAATGNSGREAVAYPAKYDNVIAVGATDSNDNRASFSTYGEELDLMAPGVDIRSTYPGDSTYEDSGTSMATPFVAGLASLMVSYYQQEGTSWDPAAIKDILIMNTIGLNGDGYPDWDLETGYGRINNYYVMNFLEGGGFAIDPVEPISFPNPFNPHLRSVRLNLSKKNTGSIKDYKIFSLSGKEVRSESGQSGSYVNWDGKNSGGQLCSTGLYFFQLITYEGEVETGKVTILR